MRSANARSATSTPSAAPDTPASPLAAGASPSDTSSGTPSQTATTLWARDGAAAAACDDALATRPAANGDVA